jgi:Nitroreductase family
MNKRILISQAHPDKQSHELVERAEGKPERKVSAEMETSNAQYLPDLSGRRIGSTMDAFGEAETPFLTALVATMRQRRSVRAYEPEHIPDSILDACFDLAILAPTSHNLECWQMIDVRDAIRLATLRHLCLDQPAAATAPHLIVAVARPDLWRRGRAMMLEYIQREKADPTLPTALREFLPLFELKYRLQIPFSSRMVLFIFLHP